MTDNTKSLRLPVRKTSHEFFFLLHHKILGYPTGVMLQSIDNQLLQKEDFERV